MARAHDPATHRRVTVLVPVETYDRITAAAIRLGVLREKFLRSAIEERLRSVEQSNG